MLATNFMVLVMANEALKMVTLYCRSFPYLVVWQLSVIYSEISQYGPMAQRDSEMRPNSPER